jgi:hypothetical protein
VSHFEMVTLPGIKCRNVSVDNSLAQTGCFREGASGAPTFALYQSHGGTMKALTTVQMMKNTSKAIISILAIFVTVSAGAQERKPVDPSGPFARRAGRITQLDSVYDQKLPANELPLTGNAAIISPCRIITNYHVAFGKSENVDTAKFKFVKSIAKGHEVNFAFDLDKAGNFKRNVKAKVVGFGNYIKSDSGILGDVAVLEMETCLDQKEFAQLDLNMAEARTDVPVGALMTVSVAFDANGKNQVLVQEGCRSESVSPIDGVFLSDCESKAGMSGSIYYEFGADKKWHWTGLHAAGNGKKRSVALNAKTIANFFSQTFGEVPMAIAPVAFDDRQPQSMQSAMANTSGKVTVQ